MSEAPLTAEQIQKRLQALDDYEMSLQRNFASGADASDASEKAMSKVTETRSKLNKMLAETVSL